MIRRVGCVFGLLLAVVTVAAMPGTASAQSGEGALTLNVEPGVTTGGGGGLLPVHLVDRQGRLFPARAGEVSVQLDGRELPSPRVVSFGPEEPYAVWIVVDAASFRGTDATAWASELAAVARSTRPGEEMAIWGLGRGNDEWWSGAGPFDSSAVLDHLTDADDTPLWDGVLLALDRLAAEATPARRRVLLLLSDGVEGRESRHPVVTCADGADTTRIAIWSATPGGRAPDEVGLARLRRLAEGTGGHVLVGDPGNGIHAFRNALAQIRGSQAILISGLDGTPPHRLTVRVNVAAAQSIPASVAARRPLGLTGGGSFPWWPLMAGLAAALVGGGIVARRRMPIGRVTVLTTPSRTVPVASGGLTIGGADGNGLVLGEPRVSRSHAVIRIEGGKVLLVDLRSSNGTKVNGRRIGSVALQDGDRILIADAVELEWRSGIGFDRSG